MKLFVVLVTAVSAAIAQDTVTATSTACEPHGDHWHCPSGVPEPTTPPPVESAILSATASEEHDHDQEETHTITFTASGFCEAHGDHWHCPSGVSEPTAPPAAVTTAADTSAIGSGILAQPSESTGAAMGMASNPGIVAVFLGMFGHLVV